MLVLSEKEILGLRRLFQNIPYEESSFEEWQDVLLPAIALRGAEFIDRNVIFGHNYPVAKTILESITDPEALRFLAKLRVLFSTADLKDLPPLEHCYSCGHDHERSPHQLSLRIVKPFKAIGWGATFTESSFRMGKARGALPTIESGTGASMWIDRAAIIDPETNKPWAHGLDGFFTDAVTKEEITSLEDYIVVE